MHLGSRSSSRFSTSKLIPSVDVALDYGPVPTHTDPKRPNDDMPRSTLTGAFLFRRTFLAYCLIDLAPSGHLSLHSLDSSASN